MEMFQLTSPLINSEEALIYLEKGAFSIEDGVLIFNEFLLVMTPRVRVPRKNLSIIFDLIPHIRLFLPRKREGYVATSMFCLAQDKDLYPKVWQNTEASVKEAIDTSWENCIGAFNSYPRGKFMKMIGKGYPDERPSDLCVEYMDGTRC